MARPSVRMSVIKTLKRILKLVLHSGSRTVIVLRTKQYANEAALMEASNAVGVRKISLCFVNDIR